MTSAPTRGANLANTFIDIALWLTLVIPSVSLAPIPGVLGIGASSGSAVATASDSAIAGIGIAAVRLRVREWLAGRRFRF
jgi:hypothetical protein